MQYSAVRQTSSNGSFWLEADAGLVDPLHLGAVRLLPACSKNGRFRPGQKHTGSVQGDGSEEPNFPERTCGAGATQADEQYHGCGVPRPFPAAAG